MVCDSQRLEQGSCLHWMYYELAGRPVLQIDLDITGDVAREMKNILNIDRSVFCEASTSPPNALRRDGERSIIAVGYHWICLR
jgi:hypothetical protein